MTLSRKSLFIVGGFLGAFLILIATVFFSLHTIRQFADASRLIVHTQRVLAGLEEILSLMQDAESSQRGFLLTGDDQHLGRYQMAVDKTPARLGDLKLLILDNPKQQNYLTILDGLISERISLLREAIRLKSEKESDAQFREVQFRGRLAMDRVRVQIGQMRAEENLLMDERSTRFEYDAALTKQAIIGANLAALMLFIVAGWMLYREVVKRSQAEQALSTSNVFLNSLVENIPNMIFVKDADALRFVRFNKAGEDLLGYTKEDLIGKNDYDFFPKEEADFFTAKDRAVLDSGQLFDIPEEQIHTKNGVRILHTMKIPIVEQGKPLYLLGISEDITARKEAEQEIKRLHQSVLERAAQLEVSNRELESFTYSVSHDLRAPLRAIDGFARMLQEDYSGKFDEQGRRWLSVIRSNSGKMGRLIDDLLAFSRIGRKSIHAVEFEMTALVREALADMDKGAADVQIEALGDACADRALLKQVWSNLLSNSVKYSGTRANPSIEIFKRENDDEVIYGIRDNGVGFDMRYYNKLFGVFERLHSVEEFDGTGVGLAIVQRIIVRHGGRVWAESKLNEGATFYFTLRSGEGNVTSGTD